jgi:hypothetical protein
MLSYKTIPSLSLGSSLTPRIGHRNTAMEDLRNTFARCQQENRSGFVTYVTAGYPKVAESVDILLGMEEGGAGE